MLPGYCPNDFPIAFESTGVRPRNPSHNSYIGVTISRPEEDVAAFGFAYDDLWSGQTDEDMHMLRLSTGELTRWSAMSWERHDPRYSGTHHGDKPYLRFVR